MNSILRVAIADDERLARSFLATTLRNFDDVELVGEAGDGAEAIELIWHCSICICRKLTALA
jgi:DNA-binding NarL/FixJ family response regulator